MQTAIILFAFNRPQHLKDTLEHLKMNKAFAGMPVFVFIDGPRHTAEKQIVEQVKQVAAESLADYKAEIIARNDNLGLKRSVITGISKVFETYEQAIILEDDICVSPEFIAFHLQCLDLYRNRPDIWSVSGFVIPEVGEKSRLLSGESAVLAQRASSWGWSTWKSRWTQAQWDSKEILKQLAGNYRAYDRTGGDKLRMLVRELSGKSSSWAIIWDYNHFIHQAYCVYPVKSFIRNIGLDNSGTHSKPLKAYDVDHLNVEKLQLNARIKPLDEIATLFGGINRKPYRYLLDRYKLMKVLSKR